MYRRREHADRWQDFIVISSFLFGPEASAQFFNTYVSFPQGESVPQIKEPIDTLDPERFLDIETDGKLHIVAGGTKIVQHTAPAMTSGLRGTFFPPDRIIMNSS